MTLDKTVQNKTLVLIRHGQAMHNVARDFSIHNPCLTELGQKQALDCYERLKTEEYDLILVSPLQRTLETSQLVFPTKSVKACEIVREHVQHVSDQRGSLDPKSYPLCDFTDVCLTHDPKPLESSEETYTRARQALEYLKAIPEKKIAIVTHYGFIYRLVEVATGEKKCLLENCGTKTIILPN